LSSIADLEKCASGHLRAYMDPGGAFAFNTYDRLYNSSGVLTPLDCFAPNLLSLTLRDLHVIPLFQEGNSAPSALLAAMQRVLDETTPHEPSFVDLATIDDEPLRLIRDANFRTDSVSQWTAVTVSKVLHRLRPRLVPVYDSLVRRFYGVSNNPFSFYRALHADMRANRTMLDDLTAGRFTPDNRPLSDLRALDIVIWHHQKYPCP
jgi:hypothetical protein